jgi:hypothetical protein
MRIRVPSKKIRERFLITYELKGCQKALDFLTEYYDARRMRIELDGRKVGKGCIAVYFENKACFTKRGFTKRTILHELYHHLIHVNGIEMSHRMEEKAANNYARDFLDRGSVGH